MPVRIRIGQEDDSLVAELRPVKALPDSAAESHDQVVKFLVLHDLPWRHALRIQDLPPEWQDGLKIAVSPLLGAPAGGVALDDEKF